MDTVFIGIVLSIILSATAPYIESHFKLDYEKAKIAIILVISFVVAIAMYVTPAQYVDSAMAIIGSMTTTYWILWKLSFNQDKISEKVKTLM